ncbi:ABC transporter ATP-binding protein [Cytobacillus kochii]|uniref:ABC transporter ATP-binding protein n=1 Tax=Cytobacillus TaxID=2675230 RepID=UPI001CD6D520|nr:ABC transporter ATP-binding protein [Cytobacillus kochii]MCA1027397.1 ABC transporter ATP-binding protein [Cytobacillus kochii]MDM5206905.1 ABC transporter ATP-binding protein [Cytobacillus kochii]
MIDLQQVAYKQGNFQLKDIHLTFPTGQITGIVGPNGSGKSTLLKLVAKLISANRGDILINHESINNYTRKNLAKELAMLVQLKEGMPGFSVRQMVAYGRTPYQKMMKSENVEDNEIIDWAMKVTGITHMSDRLVQTLSGGEQQRVRIAMALAQKTNILLLDEPTTYLDIGHQIELMSLLKELNQQFKMTIVMVLHELQYAAMYCDSMVVLQGGEIVATGLPKDILNAELLKKVYKLDADVIFDGKVPLIKPNQF